MVMRAIKKIIYVLGICIIVFYAISTLFRQLCTRHSATFKNCTTDTLVIGISHYDNIDSVYNLLWPLYNTKLANEELDSTVSFGWKDITIDRDALVFPDSLCSTDEECLFDIAYDSCYFFLIRWRNVKNSSWDEIRTKKLYHKWLITRDSDGQFDRNIRYK